MGRLHTLLISILLAVHGESRSGTIYSFEPPDLNDWVDKVVSSEVAVNSSYKNGVLVRNSKLDQYSIRMERYCVATDHVPPRVPPAQWYNPPKMVCTTEYYYVVKVQYDDITIECLRVDTPDRAVALASVKFVVIKRFHLKMYFMKTSGDCYVKHYDLPVYECSNTGHVRLPAAKCDEVFPLMAGPAVESSSSDSDSGFVVVQPV